MGNYNPYKFLSNRKICIPPTEEEKDNFELYITQMFMSMAKGVENVIERTNTPAFFKIPKKYQCMAFTALDGFELTGVWKKFKKKPASKTKKGLREKVSALLKCSASDAESYIKAGLIDTKTINDLWERVYDPNSVKVRKKRK